MFGNSLEVADRFMKMGPQIRCHEGARRNEQRRSGFHDFGSSYCGNKRCGRHIQSERRWRLLNTGKCDKFLVIGQSTWYCVDDKEERRCKFCTCRKVVWRKRSK